MRSKDFNNLSASPITPHLSLFYKLSFFASILAFLVILLGSYVRLSNAGLGCPDWPGCYGQLMVPQQGAVTEGNPLGTRAPIIDTHKAWKEMIHRYLAGTLALSIFFLALLSLFRRRIGQPKFLPLILVGVVVFQALLGMWTVTLKLHPLVVMGHLAGGYATFVLLSWQTLRIAQFEKQRSPSEAPSFIQNQITSHWKKLRIAALFGTLLLLIQITLGAWTSANYASLACPDFPTCQGKWWPEFHFSQAFTFWHEFGPNYEWGVLNNPARVTIQMMHRLGAVLVFIYWFILSLKILFKPVYADLKKNGWAILFLLLLQISLGISNILFFLPLGVAVAHTGVAALLLFSMIALLSTLNPQDAKLKAI